MNEVFPLVTGALIGAGLWRFVASIRLRWLALLCLSVIVGVAASALSGELELSWGFVPVDMLFVLLAASMTMAVLSLAASRHSTPAA